MKARPKVIGVGLNKTGTKTLKRYLLLWGFRHRTYDLDAFRLYRAGKTKELLQSMEQSDSFEDWPWPLMYREIDERFPDAKFVLTTRKTPDVWFRSLCNMAVRMGPLKDFEKHIYGYAMPQGRRDEHVRIYEAHNQAVIEHFSDRPGKLLEICWEKGDGIEEVADFLGLETPDVPPVHANKSAKVYTGDSLLLAHANRIAFQTAWYARAGFNRVVAGVRRRLP